MGVHNSLSDGRGPSEAQPKNPNSDDRIWNIQWIAAECGYLSSRAKGYQSLSTEHDSSIVVQREIGDQDTGENSDSQIKSRSKTSTENSDNSASVDLEQRPSKLTSQVAIKGQQRRTANLDSLIAIANRLNE